MDKLFWRGARTNDMRARVANEIAPEHQDLMDVRIMDHGNHDSFISLDEHCKYKCAPMPALPSNPEPCFEATGCGMLTIDSLEGTAESIDHVIAEL